MNQKVKVGFGGILLSSILLYGMPFHWGGYPLRFIIGAMVISLAFFVYHTVWKETNNTFRINHLLWLVNSTVLFQLVLIYIYLIFSIEYVWLVGCLLGLVIYLIVTSHIKNTF